VAIARALSVRPEFLIADEPVSALVSNRMAIMYLGRIVETGPTELVFDSPQHPYTAGLLDAAPRPDPSSRHRKPAIRGDIPSPFAIPTGCRFRTRCTFAEERCSLEDPRLLPVEPDRLVACHVLPFRATTSARGTVRSPRG
jgi:peptide/nickel transport system ATP-binding protein